MKIIGLEEHLATRDIIESWQTLSPEQQDVAVKPSTTGGIQRRLLNLADGRIRDMDETGMDMQVLSLTTPGVQSWNPEKAVALACAANDLVSETVRRRPNRFQGLLSYSSLIPVFCTSR